MPPAPHTPIVHARIDLAAHRARDPTAAKPDPNHHPLPGQPDPGDAHTPKRQQPVQCRGDAHAVPPLKAAVLENQQPSPRAGGASLRSAQPAKRTSPTPNARLSRTNERSPSPRAPTQTPEDPWSVSRRADPKSGARWNGSYAKPARVSWRSSERAARNRTAWPCSRSRRAIATAGGTPPPQSVWTNRTLSRRVTVRRPRAPASGGERARVRGWSRRGVTCLRFAASAVVRA